MRLEGLQGRKTTVYQIERWTTRRTNPSDPSAWQGIEVDRLHTGEPYAPHPLAKPFMASGRCWQETGVHGTFDRVEALNALDACARTAFDGYTRFRLVKRVYDIQTEEVCVMVTEGSHQPDHT